MSLPGAAPVNDNRHVMRELPSRDVSLLAG